MVGREQQMPKEALDPQRSIENRDEGRKNRDKAINDEKKVRYGDR